MYRKNKNFKKELKRDVSQLWKLLHSDNICFSESIAWLSRNAIDSEEHRKYEMMFATYLSVMIKIDNLLFVGRTYWSVYSPCVNRVYNLLLKHGYAERISELALGAANLYSQTKHKGYLGKTPELRETAMWYREKLEEHRNKYKNNTIDRKSKWNMICLSNEIFAEIYDMVESGIYIWRKSVTYSEILYGSRENNRNNNLYMDAFERLLHPHKYRWKTFLKKFRMPKRNKRKKINWKSI